MSLDQKLLDILVCPESKDPLVYFEEEGFLFCPTSKLKYEVRDDIPVMLIDEAERVDETTTEALIQDARSRGLANA